MSETKTQQSEYECTIRDWEQKSPWYRRLTARIGLQGKLILCFMALLSAGLGGSCYMFVTQSGERLADLMGEQSRQIAYALALASKPALSADDALELNRIGEDMLKSRNVLFVAFFNADAHPIPLSLASRDPDFGWMQVLAVRQNTQGLMQAHRQTGVFGDYIEVLAPVLSAPTPLPGGEPARRRDGETANGQNGEEPVAGSPVRPVADSTRIRLLGYVAVGMSQNREQAQLQRINYFVLAIGLVIVLISLPLAYLLVYRIFHPIRSLVDATNKIASGDLDAEVAIHRPDMIGTLARSFNEMVKKVKSQQEALESANERLAEANRDLEAKVHLRTEQFEAANKRLSSEIAEKEDFLRAVSHDLNAPLRNISGMASMLLMKHREKFDEDVIHRLERIQKNVEVETDLIGELLDLSRIKTRRQKIEPTEIDAMVRELDEMFENDLKSKEISLVIDNPLPVLNCERARVRQVFQNLIDNAIKYMGDGPTREIHVGCQVRANEAEFYVRDTGMGIDPDDLDKVFFVFRRGRNGAANNVAGKGVGLASVKSIIETYSGSIWVESKRGEGSTFRFTFNGQYVPAAASAPAGQSPNFTQSAACESEPSLTRNSHGRSQGAFDIR